MIFGQSSYLNHHSVPRVMWLNFWVLGNQDVFLRAAASPGHMITICNLPRGQINAQSQIHLTTMWSAHNLGKKKVVKLGTIHLTTALPSDRHFGFSCDRRSRSICTTIPRSTNWKWSSILLWMLEQLSQSTMAYMFLLLCLCWQAVWLIL